MFKFLSISLASVAAVAIVFFLPYGTWAEIGSLPAHPLIVHSVVILLPLLAVLLAVGIFKRRLFKKFHLYLIPLTALVTISVLAAKSSGESLTAAVGLPEKHAEWGNNLVPVALALLATLILYSFFTFYMRIKILSRMTAALLVLLSAGSIGMTYVVGHSGAESVWKYKYSSALTQSITANDPYTMEEVATHNTQADCWTVVNKKVYDVTSFVYRHPAGSSAIREMCGKNASEDYLSEHSGQAEPEKWLATLKIGYIK
jgi:hypothetical protein